MEPSLTRGEYWLLETVVEHSVPLCFLDYAAYDRPDCIEEMFNKPGHGLDRSQLIKALTRLFQNGWIEAELLGKVAALNPQQLLSTLDEIRPRSSKQPCTYYRLTQQGGKIWESFAAPQWDKYLKEEHDLNAREGCVTCATAWRVEKYLRYVELLGDRLIPHSIQIQNIHRWQATYWKTLSQGTQARFCWERERDPHHEDESYQLLSGGFTQFFGEWCAWR